MAGALKIPAAIFILNAKNHSVKQRINSQGSLYREMALFNALELICYGQPSALFAVGGGGCSIAG